MIRTLPALLFFCCAFPATAEIAYQKPPQAILDVMHAPAAPVPSISPAKTHILLIQRQLYPSIAVLAALTLRLRPQGFAHD